MTEDQITQTAREEAAAAARERGQHFLADHILSGIVGGALFDALRARIRRDAERPTYDLTTQVVVTRMTEAEALARWSEQYATGECTSAGDHITILRSLGIIADPTPRIAAAACDDPAARSLVERVARAISGQDEAGWADLPEDRRSRFWKGGGYQLTREEYRDDARAALTVMPDEAAIRADERERCARVAERKFTRQYGFTSWTAGKQIAAAIRALEPVREMHELGEP